MPTETLEVGVDTFWSKVEEENNVLDIACATANNKVYCIQGEYQSWTE